MRVLSKSKLMAFRQCPKRLWLEIHRPELCEVSADAEARFAVGDEVGDIARQLFDPEAKGVLIDREEEGLDAAFARTAALLAGCDHPVFEAGFTAGGAMAFADVMLPDLTEAERTWRMIEVKSSASVKDYHYGDIAVQAFVAQSAGVKLKSVALAHIDSSWVYPGDLDYRGLLITNDLTADAAARFSDVEGWIGAAQEVTARPTEPDTPIGPQCSAPFVCGFCDYCHRDVRQPEYPLDWLPRLSAKKRELLAEQGVDDLREVPDELLSEKQFLVKQHTLSDTVYFDAAGAAADLAPHGWPARFLDFEGIAFAIPVWKGTRPYQQIPFQFSLHTLAETGALEHTAHLDLSGNDPSRLLAEQLISACGSSGPIFVYSARYESSCICSLAERLPDLAESLYGVDARLVDLLPVARRRYYHPSQQGHWSLKNVLPAIAPDLSYDTLDVQDGGMAMDAYVEAIHPKTNPERKAAIEHQLLSYCKVDTLGLFRLWQFFREATHTKRPF